MLEIRNLSKSFAKKEILKKLDLTICEGETLAIIGPSGAGKSTFLRCINLLEMPDCGSMSLDGIDVQFPKVASKRMLTIRRKTTMVFQQYNLFKNKTAIQNVMESLIMVKKMDKKRAYTLSLNALERVGMKERADAFPSQLSGGQQQRVGIARASVVAPKLMLFDEPTSSLDPESISGILELIKEQDTEGRTIIIVTHEMNFAKQVADKIVVMENGVFIEKGTPQELFEHPKNPRTKEFLKKLEDR